MSLGDRGKWGEGKVRAYLTMLQAQQGFNFMRLPDARAGSFVKTTADFLVGLKTPYRRDAWMLEVKEVNHTFRLPRKNYPQDQRAMVRAWELAGFDSHVVVAFLALKSPTYRATDLMWRWAPVGYFTGDDTSSWDMQDLPLVTLETALSKFTSIGQ